MIKNVVGNPPFMDVAKRGKTQHKLWIDFTKKMFHEILPVDGQLGWVTPSSFLSPSNKIFNIFKENNTSYISFDTNEYFKKENNEPGISMAHYVIEKNANSKNAKVIKNGEEFEMTIDEQTLYLPNDINKQSFSIHKKVLLSNRETYKTECDYVTCHNVQLTRKKENCPISKTETAEHIYPIMHTNPQTWYSSIKQECFEKKKVMWTRSGTTIPFYNDGNLGITDMCYYIEVGSAEEGRILASNLNLELFKYIFKTAKWSGFGNEKIFNMIPVVPGRELTDAEMYDHFGLTKDEITYIEDYLANKIKKTTTTNWYTDFFHYDESELSEYSKYVRGEDYMGNITRDMYRIKKTAEVFTPTDNVLDVLDHMRESSFSENESFLDPSCGDGQFLSEVVIKKMSFGHSLEEALSTTYGVEIMEDNVKLCKERLAGPNPSDDILAILDKNIVCADAINYDYKFD